MSEYTRDEEYKIVDKLISKYKYLYLLLKIK